MKCFHLTTLALLFSVSSFAQITDIDGNVYQTKQIGNQVWMTENLKTTKFSNGDPIILISGLGDKWLDFIVDRGEDQPGYIASNTFSRKSDILYNGPAVTDSRGLCPKGWRVPTIIDWHLLMLHNGGWIQNEKIPCDEGIVTKLKSEEGWEFPQKNTTGFNAKPNYVIKPNGIQDDGSYFYSWAGDIINKSMYLVRIEQYLCNKISPALTTPSVAMPCRCIKGDMGEKWEDLTKEQQSRWIGRVGYEWKSEKADMKKKIISRINKLIASDKVEAAAKLYRSQNNLKQTYLEDLLISKLKQKNSDEVISIDDSIITTYIKANKLKISKFENGKNLLSFDASGAPVNSKSNLSKLNSEIFIKSVHGFEIPFKSTMNIFIERTNESIGIDYVSGYNKILYHKGDVFYKKATELPEIKCRFDEAISQDKVQKIEKFKVTVKANGQIIDISETLKVSDIDILKKP